MHSSGMPLCPAALQRCLLASSQTAYYDSTKASRFIRAGFSPAIVNLALAYNATNRGDESQVSTAVGVVHAFTCQQKYDWAL